MHHAKRIETMVGTNEGNETTLISTYSNGSGTSVQNLINSVSDTLWILQTGVRLFIDITAIDNPNLVVWQKDVVKIKIIMIQMISKN